MPPSRNTLLAWLQEDITKEFDVIQDWLNGKNDAKTDEPRMNIEIVNGIQYDNQLFYFQFPEKFDEETAELVEGNEEEFLASKRHG